MTYICYDSKRFKPETEAIIVKADQIAEEYRKQGYTLSLRQLYYQFVARDLLPNTERSYKNLGRIVSDGRMAGMISWTAIEDRGRDMSGWMIEEDPREVVRGIEYGFSLDLWKRQGVYVEVWVEKDALSSVIERPCDRWRARYGACKGYMSQSEMWRAGQRFKEADEDGMSCVLIHLGDHDPSGIDMTRDNDDRLFTFSETLVDVRRIALNMPQIEEHRPPPNPTKVSDSRAQDYLRRFGTTSWELDALPPSVIDDMVDAELCSLIDHDLWQATLDEEGEVREMIGKLYEEWPAVEEFLDREYGPYPRFHREGD